MKILCGAPRQSALIGGEHTVGAAHRIGLNETAEAMAIGDCSAGRFPILKESAFSGLLGKE